MTIVFRPSAKALILLACLPASSPAYADEQRLPEEIIVSGYRPVNTFELDTSVTVLDGRTIDDVAISNFEQLVQLVPNMTVSGSP